MRTDALFYELFQTAPQTFFELLQIVPTCAYRFESITVKASEKRIDGVIEPTDEQQPVYFLEVQAFPDDTIYWRTLREVATYFEQRPARNDNWQAVVLWLNKEDDPGLRTLKPLTYKPASRLISADLIKLLKKLPETSLVLNVLRPLLAKSEREVRKHVVQWVTNIRQTPNLDPQTEEKLVAILSQLIEQKFKTLSYKELAKMLRLTPLEETISGQELIKNAHVDILAALIQDRFGLSEALSETVRADLDKLDGQALTTLVRQILHFDTFEELETWIADRLPQTIA
jgi:predicted transposase/invertase (TIGR01784 family)